MMKQKKKKMAGSPSCKQPLWWAMLVRRDSLSPWNSPAAASLANLIALDFRVTGNRLQPPLVPRPAMLPLRRITALNPLTWVSVVCQHLFIAACG